jgi:hypothetical protein
MAAAATSTLPSPVTKSNQNLYVAIFCVGFLLRVGFVLLRKTFIQIPGVPLPYALEVSSIAAHLARGQGFSSPFLRDTGPTAWVAPIYPLLVATIFKLFGVYSNASALVILTLQSAMAAVTGVAIHALAQRTIGDAIGKWAAWVWTVSPIFFRWPVSWIWDFAASGLLLAVILISALDAAESGTRKSWLIHALLWGIAALTNPALLSILPFTIGYIAFNAHKQNRAWFKNSVISAMLFLTIIAPWAIRNRVVFGHLILFRSNFWFEFHLGNYHYSNGMGFFGFHPAANPREMRKYVELGEQAYIQQARAEAMHFVRQYPREFIDLCLHRTLWFWDGTPISYQAGEWWKPWEFWPLSVTAWLGLLFLLTRRPRGWVLYASCLVVYPLPYYFVYPVAKYRYAIEPEMLLLSVYLANLLWNEFSQKRLPLR